MNLTVVVALAAGTAAHWLLFIRGEWHLQAPAIAMTHALLAVAMFCWLESRESHRTAESILTTMLSCTCYLLSLFSSMTCYRLFMHRLRKFPGPRMAAVTKLWHVWACRDSKNFRVLDECNKRYGPFVRTGRCRKIECSPTACGTDSGAGPEEITIFHPAAIELLDGAGNHNMRSDWYDLLYPLTSPIFTRDPALHIERRKIWSQALSSKSE